MNELTIRIATPDDVAPIEEVMREAYRVLGRREYDDAQTSSAIRHIAYVDPTLIEDGTYFVVVEAAGEIVGGGGWSRRRKLFNGPPPSARDREWLDPAVDAARVRAMFVHPRWERRGIGRMVLNRCEEAARQAGFRRVELLSTLSGIALYRACGYEPLEEIVFELADGARLRGLTMGKRL